MLIDGGKRRRVVLAVVLSLAGALSACGGTPGPDAGEDATETGTEASSQSSGLPGFDPSSFGPPGEAANKWLPLSAGLQWVREGTTEIGHRRIPHRVVSTVTDITRVVDGAPAILLLDQDFDAGQVVQQSLDYLAQDEEGNVWFLGSYTEQYEGGRFVAFEDAWLAGVEGARAGVLMPGRPRVGMYWRIAQPPGEDGDAAEVVRTGTRKCVQFGCFEDVLVVREGKVSALDNEFKFYAPDLGQIQNVPRSMSAHKDVEALVNATQLSPRGLAEIRAEALKLDRNAARNAPEVFGNGRATRLEP